MALDEAEMKTMIGLINKADNDQCRSSLRLISGRLESIGNQKRATLGIGSRVSWNGKHGPRQGVVLKVKFKYVEVREDSDKPHPPTWNVPASMLTVIPKADKQDIKL